MNKYNMSSDEKKIDENNARRRYGRKATLAQVLATVAESFLLIGLGMELAMPTLVIQALYKNPNGEFSFTLNDMSWYGSILFVFHPTGSFLSGFLQEKFGRKLCMILANVPSILGWLLLYKTNSLILLYASTISMGLSIGFSEAPILSYVGEITEPRLRGSMSSLACMSSSVGALITFVFGYFFHWKTAALISTACPVTCMCLVVFIPESPVWLIAKGKHEEARKALCWLRGWTRTETINDEYLELVRYNEMSGIHENMTNGKNKNVSSKLNQFKDPSVYKPLMLVLFFFIISDIVSLWLCKPYISKIMTDVGISSDIRSLLMVFCSILQYVGCVTLMLTVHFLGKRFLTLLSVLLCSMLLFFFGVYSITYNIGYISADKYWIPITMLCGITYFGSIASNMPWMILGEIFPNKYRGLACGYCAGLSYIIMFVLTKLYLTVELFLTVGYTMIMFSCIGVVGLVYLYYYLPETENKTLLEIEDYFTSNTKKSYLQKP